MELLNSFLTALGLKNGAVIGGFLGALVSLKFIEDIAHWSWWKKITTVLAGATVAAYSTPLTVEVLELSSKAEGAIAFIGGLFGMSIAGAVMKAIPAFVETAREKWGGGK